jgi:dipeptidyl aminopeptidase/acylaminoacyl peptidase
MRRLLCLLTAVGVLTPLMAQPPTKEAGGWTPQDMIRVKRIGGVWPSPDGSRVAYTVREAILDAGKSEYLTHIYLTNATGSETIPLTRGEKSCDNPRWSPDGKWIAFVTSRSGKANIWRIRVAGGEAEQVTDAATGAGNFAWSPDGSRIAYTMLDPATAAEELNTRSRNDAQVLDRNIKQQRLYVVPVEANADGKRPAVKLTTADYNVSGFDWSPDGKQIVFAHTRTPQVDHWPTGDLSRVDIAAGKVTPLRVNTRSAESAPRYSPDGKWIAFLQSDDPPSWAFENTVCVIPAAGGEPRKLAATPDMNPVIFGWTADSQSVWASESNSTRHRVHRLSLEGRLETFVNQSGAATSGWNLSANGQVVGFSWETLTSAPEAHIARVADFTPVRLSRVNTALPNHALGKTETVRWESNDGKTVEGLLTYPVGYRAGERYPLLLVIHGGPAGVFTETYLGQPYPYPLAAFAARGYAVLRANPRGSSGYGKEFRFANMKDWGGGDYRDLMSGVDHVIKIGVADPERLGVMGWSYGGFMTSWIITHTHRFKAASVGAAVTDLVSFCGTADIPSFLPDYFKSEHWTDPRAFLMHSPIQFVSGVQTPSLIQHGKEDDRVPLSQGLELYNALKRQQVPVEMVVYPRMRHAISEPRLLLDAMNRNVEWFDRYLKKSVPPTRKAVVSDILHGMKINDPYRWLEDQNSPETRAWIAAQQQFTTEQLSKLPEREGLKKRLGELLRTDTFSTPTVRNGRYFFSKRAVNQDLPVFYVRRGADAKDEVLLDCNRLSSDNSVSATTLDISRDGRYWVYGLRRGGEDEVEVYVMPVDSGRPGAATLKRGRYFGVSITPDAKTLYYARMTAAGPRVYRTSIGKNGGEEEIFGKGYGPDKIITGSLSPDGKQYLITVLYGSAAAKTEVYVKALADDGPFQVIVNDVNARFVGQIADNKLFLMTNWQAPNNRLFVVDLNNAKRDQWKVIVPEDSQNVMQGVQLIDGKLFVSCLANVSSKQLIYSPAGKPLGEVKMPGIGTGGVSGEWTSKEAFLTFNSFVHPTTVYRYDPSTGLGAIWSRQNVPIDVDRFEVSQVRYRSKDGTMIPMFLVHAKGLKRDGNNPVYLTGYGGFNLSRTPLFSASIALWVERGGVYALPSLRGGGEFGEAWHRAGMLEKKQNVFDDFHAAAEWLISNNYTRPEKLAIAGGSNGGLLVGGGADPAPGVVPCGYLLGSTSGYGALSPLFGGAILGAGIWLFGESRTAQVSPGLFALSQREAQHEIPGGVVRFG